MPRERKKRPSRRRAVTERRPEDNAKKPQTPKRRSFREIIREFPTAEEWAELQKGLKRAPDLVFAISMSSQVERYLEYAIALRLPKISRDLHEKLTDRDGPLRSFYSKIWLAYAMDFITADIRDDLNIIREIRNLFAHSIIKINFQIPEVVAKCEALKHVPAEIRNWRPTPGPTIFSLPNSRDRFDAACDALTEILLESAVTASRRLALAHALMDGGSGTGT